MTDFHMPGGWYEPPAEHDCPSEPGECTCEEDARDAYEDHLIDRADARRKGDEDA
jgi:hypothetical protein